MTPDPQSLYTLWGPEPARDCPLCPRLVAYREANRAAHPDWWNGPPPSFGPEDAKLLVLGLAPGRMGANRTGRPFTGDYAGVLLYETLLKSGFARGRYEARPDDGLELVHTLITNAVRCAPPENKPTGVEEASCRPFLTARLDALPRLRAVVTLGDVSRRNLLRALRLRPDAAPPGHGVETDVPGPHGPLRVFSSYHCSRLNTNTGRLTPAMFQAVFARVRAHLDGLAPAA